MSDCLPEPAIWRGLTDWNSYCPTQPEFVMRGQACSNKSLLLAIDGEYATDDTPLTNGCELAAFPPVSGG